ncbi:MAG: hypothetical protein WA705_20555 [Candidatus Ozemobacteraceae bacterium]
MPFRVLFEAQGRPTTAFLAAVEPGLIQASERKMGRSHLRERTATVLR